MKQTNSPFEEWYDGMVGFHLTSERILDDFKYDIGGGYHVDPEKLRKWMVVCWNQALEAAQEAVDDDPFAHHQSNLEKLKEKF